jgi:putative PIN family toxin of toxin-antitoxin system
MVVVVDTNVLLSSLLSSTGPPARMYEAWRKNRFQIVTCPEQLAELRTASRYPHLAKAIRPYQFGILLNELKKCLITAKSIPRPHAAHDPEDSFLLNLAQFAKADYLITGDKRSRILTKTTIANTRILTARDFCDQVLR